jgi:hypothetical protein
MKSILLASWMLFGFISAYAHDPGEIDEKLMLIFKKTFPAAENVNWSQSGETVFISFLDQGVNTRVTYSKDGNLLGSIRYYQEKGLPLQLRLATKQQFPGKKIFGVTEVSAFTDASHHQGAVYYIRLEDEKAWLTIVSDNEGNSKLVETFEKG